MSSGVGRCSFSRNCGTLADFLGVFGADRGGVDLDRCGLSWARLVPLGNSLPTSLPRDFLGVVAGLAFGRFLDDSLAGLAAAWPLRGFDLRGESDFVGALPREDALW